MRLSKQLLAMLLLVCMVFSILAAVALTASAANETATVTCNNGNLTMSTNAGTERALPNSGGIILPPIPIFPTEPTEPTTEPTEPTEPIEPTTNPITVDSFKDIEKDAWYFDGVKYAIDKGLMLGVDKGKFAPEETLTRAMLVTILYRLAGEQKDANAKLAFTDVKKVDWFYDAVAWAVKAGVANGTSATTFDPDASVTREQLVTFLWRYAGEKASSQSLSSFTDDAAVSEYALTAIRWAVENKVINGKDGGKLDPQGDATRAEIAVIFMRAEKLLAQPK